MPLFDYLCVSCGHTQEHFHYSSDLNIKCPTCSSEDYNKKLSVIVMNVEYGNPKENYERKIKPHIDSTYEQIGKETLDGDSKTAENIFGKEQTQKTFSGTDE